MLILNDCHIGAARQGGTTPASQQALKDYLRRELGHLLRRGEGAHIVINGDFFDAFAVETSELIAAYEILSEHLRGGKLTLIMGNHDASAKAGKVSSWHMLCYFLAAAHGEKFRAIDASDGLCLVQYPVWAIAHQLNQEAFDAQIERAAIMPGDGKHLLLHCNILNKFSEQADHSLNLDEAQMDRLLGAGWSLIVGHEHIGRTLRDGRVRITGNQTPSSIQDCLGDAAKEALWVTETGCEPITSWRAEGGYLEVDWRTLQNRGYSGEQFIRVTGDACAQEAAEVVKAISRFRQTSSAFVLSNAVSIDGGVALGEMAAASLDEVRGFDVLSAIYEHLTPEEGSIIKGILS